MDYCMCGRRAVLTFYLCVVCYDAWLARHVPEPRRVRAAYLDPALGGGRRG